MANITDRQAVDIVRGILPECRIIRLVGYAQGNKEYRIAKQAKEKGWNSLEYKQLSDAQLISNLERGEWIGLMIPSGYIVVDFDTLDAQSAIDMLKEMNIKCHTIKTPRGYQAIFKDTGRETSQRAKLLTKAGFLVDYRLANKGYIVLPSNQTDGRYWLNIEQDPIHHMPILFESISDKSYENEDRPIEIPLGEGSRNDALFRHAGRLCKKGIPTVQVIEIIEIINDYLTYPSLDEREIRQILRPEALKSSSNGQTLDEFNASLDAIGAPHEKTADTQKSIVFELSDVGNGQRLVHHFGDRLRYVDTQSSWYVWDGQRWTIDETKEIDRIAKDTALVIMDQAIFEAKNNDDQSKKHSNIF